ncbi:MAG: ABC transporter ATP-binding protein [Cyclobacteriaceae bacterium]|nr:ABC transporter ATP-binding protein [Cyclobacteriaceae bacterium]
MKIVANNLSKRYNREWIFRNFSNEFHPKQTYAITGPNGSGKSTLLQVLWGQLQPSGGDVNHWVNDKPLAVQDVFTSIAIATPYMDLLDEFTLREMVQFHFQFKKIRNNKSVEEVIDLTGLKGSEDKQISNFSSGMKQRLKLSLAFQTEANGLFLDEPTTNLDKKSIQWYWDQLIEVQRFTTILIASNDEGEYPPDADKIDILSFK